MADATIVPMKNPSSASRVYDGEAVIAIADKGEVHVVNEVATRVWNLIDGNRSLGQIVALVQAALDEEGYEGVPANLTADIEGYLEDLKARGMISIGETGA